MSNPSTDPAPTRKARDRAQREADFLDAAERLISEGGFHGTTMEDVAREAEYATGTIYRYFDSKDDLYQRLLDRKGRAFFDVLEASVPASGTPLEQFHGRIAAELDFYESNRAFMRVYHHELRACDEEKISCMPKDVQAQYARYMEGWSSILTRGMDEGSFRRMDVNMAIVALRGLFRELMQRWVHDDAGITRRDVEQFLGEFLSTGLISKQKGKS